MLSLLELQQAFGRALLDGDASAIAGLIAEDGMPAGERLDVYRNNVVASLTAVLADGFPTVCRLVDARFFAYAAHEFIRAHPPERPCLAEYGAGFPEFLAAFPPCRALVYLADVARLEWLMHAAAHGDAPPALTPLALQPIAADDLPFLVFCLAPSLGYLASRWPVDRIWRANRAHAADDETVDLDAGDARLEVRRRGADVELRTLTAAVFAFRQALHQGRRLETAAARAFDADETFDLAAAIADLFRDGAVIGLHIERESTS